MPLNTSSLEWQGQRLPTQLLLHLLRYGLAAEHLRQGSLLLEQTQTGERDGTAIGIGVDRLVAQQQLAVKPLGVELAAPAYRLGCAVGATGFLILILDGWSLGQLHHQRPLSKFLPKAKLSPSKIAPTGDQQLDQQLGHDAANTGPTVQACQLRNVPSRR
ncbi:MAG: hypothetical protein ACUVRV_12725 [Cyanobacteriota bacterium]